jgi:hypothetical protein
MLSQPEISADLSAQDTFSAEEGLGGADTAGMAAPPSGETQLREAPAAAPAPTTVIEHADMISPTPAATAPQQGIADNAAASPPSPSPGFTQAFKGTTVSEAQEPEQKPAARWLIVAGAIVLLASAALFGVGRWKSRQ